MARTWFGEIGPCCCLPTLLNFPAAFWQPRANHKGVPSTSFCNVFSHLNFYLKGTIKGIAARVRYYQCGAPVKHRCKCFTVSPVQNHFTGVSIFVGNVAFPYKSCW